MSERHLIVICGPTAVGKTRIGAQLAREFGLHLVSADSRQVYKYLNIGSGKDMDEYQFEDYSVPVHMVDVEEPEEIYSLFHYQRDCFDVLRKLKDNTKPVLMVGGTGLYIESVLKKYAISEVPENRDFRIKKMNEEQSVLESELKEADPDLYKRTDTSSKKRIVRALEIHYFSSSVCPENRIPDIDIKFKVFCVKQDKEKLYERINTRLHERVKEGMIEEVKGLLDRGIPLDRLFMLGLEYKEIALFLSGKKSKEEMLRDLELGIRRMAKRQMTYFRGFERRGIPVEWVVPDDTECIREYIINRNLTQ
ncbi:MAG: tRNA (adenosine(37)-N6)-dimethylallyltransferase MiaA [Fibrobacteria bacterium]|nr:tRNA (adenosine(37)-N6)-dimethylallyltransferase MiaA [Fibrobacteria bacterium]